MEKLEELIANPAFTRRGFVAAAASAGVIAGLGFVGRNAGASEASSEEDAADTAAEESAEDTSGAASYDDIEIEEATAEEVQAILDGSNADGLLVDARPQDAYAGWAIEGAANGGHLAGAALFSARWLDCDYASDTPRADILQREITDQLIDAAGSVIVYDYTGEQATKVAQYLAGQGIAGVKSFKANELIDAGENLESYENYQRFVPPVLVKSVSDVKTGAADALSDEAAAVFGSDASKIVLVDVGWGNAKLSSYFMTGHVPGAVHINTDCYERPRVYVPEKRSDYAKEWRLIPLEEFRDSLCPEYGISQDSVVILTGTGTSPLGRLGFMLRTLGVQVHAMSGLLTAWKYEGYGLDTTEDTLVIPEAVESFGSDEIANPDEILWFDDVFAILNGEAEGQLCDNRDDEEWEGEYSGYSYHDLAGRIEGSIHCDFNCLTNVDGTARTQEEYAAYMLDCGVDTTKPAVFFCGDSWGAAGISWYCQSVDLNNVKQWGNGWIPYSNLGYEFIDHNGNKVHYDKWLDTVVDADGNDMRDGVNILDD